jgi:hypothetical protein
MEISHTSGLKEIPLKEEKTIKQRTREIKYNIFSHFIRGHIIRLTRENNQKF